MVYGAAVGGEIARRSGDIARLWGPALAAGSAVIVLPPVVAAVMTAEFSVTFNSKDPFFKPHAGSRFRMIPFLPESATARCMLWETAK